MYKFLWKHFIILWNIWKRIEGVDTKMEIDTQKRSFKIYNRYNGLMVYFLEIGRLRGSPLPQRILNKRLFKKEFKRLKIYNHVYITVVCQF